MRALNTILLSHTAACAVALALFYGLCWHSPHLVVSHSASAVAIGAVVGAVAHLARRK